VARSPERRVSLVSDRRRVLRGGRRHEDRPVSYPSLAVPCPACLVGVADIVAVSPNGDLQKLTYRCAACDQEFESP
jgi:hypothetical protein